MPLQQSRKHKMIAGVCGWIAEWLGRANSLRYNIVSVLSVVFPGILIYVILWILMPKAPEYWSEIP